MARFFFATFWTVVFAGAVRKWIFPGNPILYLLQDIPIGLTYLAAIRYGFYNRGLMMFGIVILSAAIILQTLMQIMIPGLSPIVAAIGLHNYLFYLPMMLVFPFCLTPEYRQKYIRFSLLLSIPMCLLAIVQAQSPKFSWVNKTSEGDAFGVAGSEVARATGTFNFSSFYGIWVAMTVALCMGEWLLRKERRAIQRQWLMVLCTFTVNLCHLVAASRSAIALAGMAILGGLAGAILLRSTRAIAALVGVCVLLPVAAGATYMISPDEYNIVMQRFTGESYVADTKDRVSFGVVGFLTEPKFSLIGAGVGMGVDAAHVGNANAYNFTYTLSEYDIIRVVMELGTPVGLFYAFTRLFFGVGMILLAVRMVRMGNSPHVLPMAFFLMAQIYQGDLTRNAAMSASQSMLGFSLILGAYYHPDTSGQQSVYDEFSTRSA